MKIFKLLCLAMLLMFSGCAKDDETYTGHLIRSEKSEEAKEESGKESGKKKKDRYSTRAAKAIFNVTELEDGGNILIIYDDGTLFDTGLDSSNYARGMSADGTAAYVWSDSLYALKGEEVTDTENVPDSGNIFISERGNTIAFFTDVEYLRDTFFGTLMLYDIDTDETTTIDEMVISDEESIVLSPDGKTVVYCKESEEDTDITVTYCYKGDKEPSVVGEDIFAVAAADDGEYIYYVHNKEDGFFVNKSGKEVMLSEGIGDGLMVNADRSEVMFWYDGNTYVSENASKAEKITDDSFSYFYLPGEAMQYWIEEVLYTGLNTFKGELFFTEEGNVYRMEKLDHAELIISGVKNSVLSDDGKTMVYVNENDDYIYKISISEPEEAELLYDEKEVYAAFGSGDLSAVFFMDYYDDVYCLAGEEARKLEGEMADFAFSKGGEYFYYLNDSNEMYVIEGTDEPQLLFDSEEDGKVLAFLHESGKFFVGVEKGNFLQFYTMDGAEPKKVSEEEING